MGWIYWLLHLYEETDIWHIAYDQQNSSSPPKKNNNKKTKKNHQNSSTLGDESMPPRVEFSQIQFFASGLSHGTVAQNGSLWSLYSMYVQL